MSLKELFKIGESNEPDLPPADRPKFPSPLFESWEIEAFICLIPLMMATQGILSNFLFQYDRFIEIPGILLFYLLLRETAKRFLSFYINSYWSEITSFTIALLINVVRPYVLPDDLNSLFWGFGLLWFFGLKFYNDDRHKYEHIINTIDGPYDELGLEDIHPDVVLVDINNLTSKGIEIVERAIDSDRNEFTVYRKKRLC